MIQYWYICDVNPVPWRVGPVGATRNPSTGRFKGYVGRDEELHVYQQAIAASLREQNPVLVEGDISVTMWFWRNIAEYRTEKDRKAMSHHADGTNMYKATEDACQKILFQNDRSNISGHWYIVEQDTEAASRVLICVEKSDRFTREDPLSYLPEEVYGKIFGTGGEQLKLAMEKPNTELAREDDKYAQAEVDF